MSTLSEYLLPIVPVALVLGGLAAARMTLHRPIDLSRALSINALMGCCFAGPFVRFGWDKGVVAFLFIFSITSLFAVGRWAEHRHYQSTLASKERKEKVKS